MVLGKSLAEERLEAIVVSRLHSVAAHSRVRVLDATVEALQERGLVLIGQRLVVLWVVGVEADIVGVVLE